MANGRSRVSNPLRSADCGATRSAIEAFGCTVERQGDTDIVCSPGFLAWQDPLQPIDCGNSGTTARLLLGLCACRPGGFTVLFGDQSLSSRPMARVTGPLGEVGGTFSGRAAGTLLPISIEGKAATSAHHQLAIGSAQVKSALLLGALWAPGETTIRLPAGARDHTESMLRSLGADLTIEHQSDWECITFKGPFAPTARGGRVPGDPSSAAFLATLHLLHAKVGASLVLGDICHNPTRSGFYRALEGLGNEVNWIPSSEEDFYEPTAKLTITKKKQI